MACANYNQTVAIIIKPKVIQPHLILDKSVLQMLNPRELFELEIFFQVTGTPILTNEILADLEKPAGKNRLPREMVKALAAKRWSSPMEPMHFRKAALTNLLYQDVPMRGATFIDIDAPHVTKGLGLSINLRPLQHVWARWAAGDFSPLDTQVARSIRMATEGYDPAVIRDGWQPYTTKHFAACKTLPELIVAVDDLMATFSEPVQRVLLRITMGILKVPYSDARLVWRLFNAGLIPRLQDYARYAAYITRLSLVYICGITKGLVKAGDHDVGDMQYLFYAPFCHVFASNDKLHRTLWATVQRHIPTFFIWGDDLKKDLRIRADLREQSPARVAGPIPITLPDSVINAACNQWK